MRITKLDDERIQELSVFIENGNLIPVIGSGFTCGCCAKRGRVPSGSDLANFFRAELSKHEDAGEDYGKYDLKVLASLFDKSQKIPIFTKQDYLLANFTEVKLSRARDFFLNIPWPCIYTINIDDAIEKSTKRKVILPLKEFTSSYIEEFSIIFKMHGDVHDLLAYDKKDAIILNYTQYIDSLNNNRKMLNKFRADLADNNIVFIGCSLTEEYDLFVSMRDNIKKNEFSRKIYYIAYKGITKTQETLLEDFGVTDCIIIDDLDSFCRQIRDRQSHAIYSSSSMNSFSRTIQVLTREESTSLFMLKSDSLAPLSENKFFKPSFFIEREVLTNVIRSLMESPLHIIFGHRISGKTYFLFSIYEKMIGHDRYFFPSGTKLSSAMFNEVLDKKNSLMIFDSGSLSTRQVIDITQECNIKRIKSNLSYIVFAVNSSDSTGIDIEENKAIRFTYLNNVFFRNESLGLSAALQLCNIPTFTFIKRMGKMEAFSRKPSYKTLLDNLYELAQYEKKCGMLSLPDLSKISDAEELAFWIFISIKQVIDTGDIHYYNFQDVITDYENKYPVLLNRYFSSTGGRINFRNRFTLNARYYVLNWLGTLADNPQTHELILSAYLYLFESIEYNENGEIQEINKKMLDLIKFDVINDIFYRKTESAIILIKYIYEKFEEKLNNTPQFKHQRAKSILWLCHDKKDDIEWAAEYINLACHDIEELLSTSPDNINLKRSLKHAFLTQAIIYGRLTTLDNYNDNTLLEHALNNYARVLLDPTNEALIVDIKNKSDDHMIFSDIRQIKRYINRERNSLPSNITETANAIFQIVKF